MDEPGHDYDAVNRRLAGKVGCLAAWTANEAQQLGDYERARRLAREESDAERAIDFTEEGQPVREIIVTPDGAAAVRRGRNGLVLIDITPRRAPESGIYGGGGAATVAYSPWDVIVTPTGGSGYDYIVIPSTVNQVVPNNWLTVGTGSTSAAKYLSLAVSATSGRVTSVAIQSGASPGAAPPVIQGVPPSSFEIPIGVIGTDGLYYKFVSAKPILASPVVAFESDRVAPIPGLSPRDQWWTWAMSQP